MVGKNIFNATNYTVNWGGSFVTYNKQEITVKRNAINSGGISANPHSLFYNGFIPANTSITLSMRYKSGTGITGSTSTRTWAFYIYRVNKDGSVVNQVQNRIQLNILGQNAPTQIDFSKSGSFSEDSYGLKIGCYIPGDSAYTDGTELIFDVQVEIGSTATSYEPYSETTQLLSLGDIQVQPNQAIQKYNDEWCLDTTPIEDTTLIGQLDNVMQIPMNKGTTNIFTTTENDNPILETTYYKDLDTLVHDIDTRLSILET